MSQLSSPLATCHGRMGPAFTHSPSPSALASRLLSGRLAIAIVDDVRKQPTSPSPSASSSAAAAPAAAAAERNASAAGDGARRASLPAASAGAGARWPVVAGGEGGRAGASGLHRPIEPSAPLPGPSAPRVRYRNPTPRADAAPPKMEAAAAVPGPFGGGRRRRVVGRRRSGLAFAARRVAMERTPPSEALPAAAPVAVFAMRGRAGGASHAAARKGMRRLARRGGSGSRPLRAVCPAAPRPHFPAPRRRAPRSDGRRNALLPSAGRGGGGNGAAAARPRRRRRRRCAARCGR